MITGCSTPPPPPALHLLSLWFRNHIIQISQSERFPTKLLTQSFRNNFIRFFIQFQICQHKFLRDKYCSSNIYISLLFEYSKHKKLIYHTEFILELKNKYYIDKQFLTHTENTMSEVQSKGTRKIVLGNAQHLYRT